MKMRCFLSTIAIVTALFTVSNCHPISAEQRSEYATEGAAFRVTLTYEAANPQMPQMPGPEDAYATYQAAHAQDTPRPTETSTLWPTLTPAMPSSVHSICLDIEQSFTQEPATMPDPLPFAMRTLENSGYSVTDSSGACDASLVINLSLEPLSEEYTNLGGSGTSTCYTGAQASGTAILTMIGQPDRTVEVSGVRSPTSGFFVIISDCPSPGRAPFGYAAQSAVFNAMVDLVGTQIIEGALKDEDAEVRKMSLWKLEEMFEKTGYTGRLDLLLSALDDTDNSVRSTALTVLGAMEEAADPAFDKLVTMLGDPDADIRRSVLDTLSRIRRNDPSLIDPLITALHDTDINVAYTALNDLCYFGRQAERAVPDVIQFGRNFPSQQIWVFSCLKQLTGQDLGDDLDAWQNWWVKSVNIPAR